MSLQLNYVMEKCLNSGCRADQLFNDDYIVLHHLVLRLDERFSRAPMATTWKVRRVDMELSSIELKDVRPVCSMVMVDFYEYISLWDWQIIEKLEV